MASIRAEIQLAKALERPFPPSPGVNTTGMAKSKGPRAGKG